MIFHARYRYNGGAYRPFVAAYVLSADRKWVRASFLIDTGPDETFLPYAQFFSDREEWGRMLHLPNPEVSQGGRSAVITSDGGR